MKTEYQPQLFRTDKSCKECGETKPLSDFSRHPTCADGHLGVCKKCKNAYKRGYYAANRNKINAQQRQRYAEDNERQRAVHKAWRDANREELRKRQQAHADANRDAYRAAQRKHRELNREAINAAQRERYWADPEKARAKNKATYQRNIYLERQRSREYRLQNPEEVSERIRQWRLANPDKVRELGRIGKQKRRARMHAVSYEQVDFEAIYERDAGICHICETNARYEDTHFDHVIPLSRGGSHTHDNIKVAHASCNQRKGAKLLEEM